LFDSKKILENSSGLRKGCAPVACFARETKLELGAEKGEEVQKKKRGLLTTTIPSKGGSSRRGRPDSNDKKRERGKEFGVEKDEGSQLTGH